MHKHTILIGAGMFVTAFGLIAAGCGGDDDTGTGGSGTTTTTTSTSTSTSTTSTTTTGSGGGTTTTTETGGGGGGTGGAGGGGSASAEAIAFCNDYETTCGFGTAGYFASMGECLTSYDGFDAARQACVEMHLGYAAQDPATHCPHAAGAGPCM